MSQYNSPGSYKANKRRHVDVLSSVEEVAPEISDSWPRFITVASVDGSPLKPNPFAISLGIRGVCGDVKNVTRLRTGALLVECLRKQQSVNLLGLQQFVNTPVVVSVHKTLNTSRGIVRDVARCLSDMSEEEIAVELKSQGVTHVKRFSRKAQDGAFVKTNTYLFTFSQPVIPKSLKAGYFNIGVEVYVPNPLRCFKCQKFGHGAKFCRSKMVVCCRCTGAHDSSECTNDLKCANCNEDHMASSKSCPSFEFEAQILRNKHTNNITYQEAKRLVPSPAQTYVKTYSAAIASSTRVCKTVSVSCQTDISWVKDDQTVLHQPSDISQKSNMKSTTSQTDNPTSDVPSHSMGSAHTGDANLTRKEKKKVQKRRKALTYVETPTQVLASVEVHNSYEPLEIDVPPSQPIHRSEHSSQSRSPVKPP
ncbi:uncharacterized protein [Haliotis asinina]|uniref:uncharacterized protein n=1 Tax=Haliotis asinina TaxID=109174 RepID=UPI00353276EA